MKELSYKDTERDIEVKIFGLDFKISNEIEKLNVEEIEKQAEIDEKIVEKIIDDILGKDATKKINEKRVADGYEEMNINIQTQVLSWLFQQYMSEVLKPINNTVNSLKNYDRRYKRNRNYNNRYRRY